MSEGDPNLWQRLAENHPAIPFLALSVAKAGDHIQRPIFTRIIEGVIIGLVGGAIDTGATMWTAMQVYENDMEWLQDTMQDRSKRFEHRLDRLEAYHWERRD